MTPLEHIYKGGFFSRRHKLNWRAPIICKAIAEIFEPKTLVDVGCATGDLVAEFVRMGIDAYGIEGSRHAEPHLECAMDRVHFHDLREPLPSHFGKFDLVLCFEVAEHIEPEFSTQFVTTLCVMGHRILMSAAPPGQGGHHHVNCRHTYYWVDLMAAQGFYRQSAIESELRLQWDPWAHKPGIKAFYDNLLYFERGYS